MTVSMAGVASPLPFYSRSAPIDRSSRVGIVPRLLICSSSASIRAAQRSRSSEFATSRPIQIRERSSRLMAQINDNSNFELNEASDFDPLLSSDGYISICGFGSLLSEKSARSSFPELRNFRVAILRGFRRVFAHAAPVFFERGIAKPETGEISSLSVEPCDGEILIVTVFEIHKSEIPLFIEREHEFRFLAVLPEELDGTSFCSPAVICSRYSDEEYFRLRCRGSKEVYYQRYGRYNIDKIWRDDILPCRVYLRHCVLAAKNLGDEAHNNFLDHTFIADRTTSIRRDTVDKSKSTDDEVDGFASIPSSVRITLAGRKWASTFTVIHPEISA